MLELTDIQARILEKLVKNYADPQGKFRKGMTSAMIRNLGIDSKSFRLQKDTLRKNYLIRLNRIEYHGLQNWYYYKITKLGLLSFLKWKSKENVPTKITLNKFSFPLIGNHITDIKKMYGKTNNLLFEQSIENLGIEPMNILISNDKKIESTTIYLEMTIPLKTIEIKIYFKHEFPPIKIIDYNKRDYNVVDDYSDEITPEIDKDIERIFTFLFYFSTLSLKLDGGRRLELFLKTLNLNRKKPTEKQFKKYEKKLIENSKLIQKIIKNDKKLYLLFRTMLEHIEKSLKHTKLVNQVEEMLI